MKSGSRQSIGPIADTFRGFADLAKIMLSPSRKSATAAKHLLLLAWIFPPETSGGTFRPASIVKFALKLGWKVTVVCGPRNPTPTNAGLYLEDYVGSGASVIRISPSRLNPSYKLFPRMDGGFHTALETILQLKEDLSQSPPTVIVASGPPFHNFLAAVELARIFNVPSVMDYRDEWTLCPFDFVRRGNIDQYVENYCLKRATALVYTTQSFLEYSAQQFPVVDHRKQVVIPNGWEEGDVALISRDAASAPRERFRLAFVGNLAEHTLPSEFLKLAEQALRQSPRLRDYLRIVFVGKKSERALEQLRRFEFQDNLELISEQPKHLAMAIMQEVDGLLLINDVPLHRYRPGKLYDYIAMRTPILVFGDGGEVAQLVRTLGVGVIMPMTQAADTFSESIDSLATLRSSESTPTVNNWLREHTRENLSVRFLDFLATIDRSTSKLPST